MNITNIGCGAQKVGMNKAKEPNPMKKNSSASGLHSMRLMAVNRATIQTKTRLKELAISWEKSYTTTNRKKKKINDTLNRKYKQIEELLDNKYIFGPFWKHVRGELEGKDWENDFKRKNKKVRENFKRKMYTDVFKEVFWRLYQLRNQVFHGGVTSAKDGDAHSSDRGVASWKISSR